MRIHVDEHKITTMRNAALDNLLQPLFQSKGRLKYLIYGHSTKHYVIAVISGTTVYRF